MAKFDFGKIIVSGLISSCKNPLFDDALLKSMFAEVAEMYCKGEKSIDEAMSEFESKSKNYLAERKQ